MRQPRFPQRLVGVPLLLTALLAMAPAGAGPAAADPLPRIGEALSCARRGEAGGLAAGSGLFRVPVDTTAYPRALCNDGTAAVFYVRKHTAGASRDRWYLELQGGGACTDGDSCARRWCSADTNFGADKMSSSYAPKVGMRASGILADDSRNPVRDWNQVFVYYCSSDGWIGRAGDTALVAAEAPGGGEVAFRMPFRGADVIDAVVDLLRRGRGAVTYLDAAGARQTLPDLDGAERVLLGGASAGSGGVVYNADRIGALLRSTNVRCQGAGACPLDYRALIDSGFKASFAEMVFTPSPLCTEDGLCSYAALQRFMWTEVMVGLRKAGGADASCLAWHRAHAPGTAWRCSDSEHVIEDHLATPFFVRQDLQDRLHLRGMVEAGLSYDGAPPMDPLAYGRHVEERLRGLATAVASGEEVQAGAAPPPAPTVFGAQCTEHETLRDGVAFYEHRAPAADGESYTTASLLAAWLADEGPPAAVVHVTRAGRLPGCGR